MRIQTTIIIYNVIVLLYIAKAVCAQDPSNITRAVDEEDVFIPCQSFEFRQTPPIWRINGKDYTSATLPSFFSQVPGGLFIGRVHRCLNGYTFQCIDTSGDGLMGQSSSIGTLTVTSLNSLPYECSDEFLIENTRETIELDHERLEFGNKNITLFWKIFSEHRDCNVSKVHSYPKCEPSDIRFINITNKTYITVPSEISGMPSSNNISSSSSQPMMRCPKLPEIVQFDVNKTETVPLLLGKNNCTCVEIECNGGLTVVVTNPNSTLPDIVCPAYVLSDKCFNIGDCANFNAYHPFFHICENPMDHSRCSVCFEDITPELSGVKLFFYTLVNTAVICGSQEPPSRVYFKSLLLNTTSATAEIVFNATTREICFISSLQVQECGLSQSTRYNVSITDITKYLIFKNNSVPESYCVRVNAHKCGPFHVSAHPYSVSNSVKYSNSSIKQKINTGNESFCPCLKQSVQFHISASDFNSVNYTCSSVYLSQVEITIATEDHEDGKKGACTDGNVSFDDSCGRVNICGYWTVNGSVSFSCPLDCTSLVVPCPAPKSNIALTVSAIVVPLVVVLSICVIVALCAWCIHKRVSNSQSATQANSGTSPAQLQDVSDTREQAWDSGAEDKQVQGEACSSDK